jgi:hypothetical protein
MVSWRCSGGVLVVLRDCFFLTKLAHLSVPNWRQRKRETLLLGLYAGLVGFFLVEYEPTHYPAKKGQRMQH